MRWIDPSSNWTSVYKYTFAVKTKYELNIPLKVKVKKNCTIQINEDIKILSCQQILFLLEKFKSSNSCSAWNFLWKLYAVLGMGLIYYSFNNPFKILSPSYFTRFISFFLLLIFISFVEHIYTCFMLRYAHEGIHIFYFK